MGAPTCAPGRDGHQLRASCPVPGCDHRFDSDGLTPEHVATRIRLRGGESVVQVALVVRATPEGHRNHALNRAAFKLGQLVKAGALRRDDVVAVLLAAALAAGLTEAEASPTIRGGLRAGMSKPRVLALCGGGR